MRCLCVVYCCNENQYLNYYGENHCQTLYNRTTLNESIYLKLKKKAMKMFLTYVLQVLLDTLYE